MCYSIIYLFVWSKDYQILMTIHKKKKKVRHFSRNVCVPKIPHPLRIRLCDIVFYVLYYYKIIKKKYIYLPLQQYQRYNETRVTDYTVVSRRRSHFIHVFCPASTPVALVYPQNVSLVNCCLKSRYMNKNITGHARISTILLHYTYYNYYTTT